MLDTIATMKTLSMEKVRSFGIASGLTGCAFVWQATIVTMEKQVNSGAKMQHSMIGIQLLQFI